MRPTTGLCQPETIFKSGAKQRTRKTAPFAMMLGFLLACMVASANAAARTRRLLPSVVSIKGLGHVRGVVNTTSEPPVRYFRSIPYAQPPTGDLRWRPPVPAKPWLPAPLDATAFRADCAQLGPGWKTLRGVAGSSEDCLHLSIYQPAAEQGAKLPVMVFFPAGGFTYGASNDVESRGLPLVDGTQVIMVTVQYRLSVFGYLAGGPLRPRSPGGSTGNYGTQDQRAALQWVQDHIGSFGGDPGKVTIWGESAGTSTHAQCCGGVFDLARASGEEATTAPLQPRRGAAQRSLLRRAAGAVPVHRVTMAVVGRRC